MAMTQAQLERQREYRLRTGNAVQKKYYQANKAKIYQASKDWRAANPEKVREMAAAWRAANPEKVREMAAAWRAANPEKVKIIRKKALKNSKQRRQSSIAAFANHQFSVIKSRAKQDGRGLKITANYLETLLRNANGVCQVSGLPITYKIGDVHIASFDRIDNNKGYVYGNIQVVSSYVNYAKQEFSQEMLFEVAKGIVAHHNL
jgi:hypothetical protein